MRKWWYFALSVLLLLPVYWQPRLQAGDLASHMDNAWLPQLIETGRAQGMTMLRQTTNLLFDLMMNALFRVSNAEIAQRLSVSIAVLVFVWGAFRFISVVGGRPSWHMLPCIAMLAYGWVFHMGFFNFYLGMGLCFWALAAAWDWRPRWALCTVPLLALAYVAHDSPWCGPLPCWFISGSRGACRRGNGCLSPAGGWHCSSSRRWRWAACSSRLGRPRRSKWSPAPTRYGSSTVNIMRFS